jgi:two-component system phosphate regulon response regulator PhoB
MGRSLSILIVDDEPRIRLALEYNLRRDGFEVFTAKDGAEGLNMARDIKPDIILLDWMMPEMTGIDVLRILKMDDRTSGIPVFLCTAKSTIGDVDRGYNVGADHYITKPFDVWKIADLLREKYKAIKK